MASSANDSLSMLTILFHWVGNASKRLLHSDRCRRGGLRPAGAEWRLMSAAAALTMPFAASAQVSTNLERAPTLTIERYSEDWSGLANPNRTRVK